MKNKYEKWDLLLAKMANQLMAGSMSVSDDADVKKEFRYKFVRYHIDLAEEVLDQCGIHPDGISDNEE